MSVPEGFDVKAAHVVATWPYDRPLLSCRIDPLGRYVFSGSEDAHVERFQLSDGARTLLEGGHKTWVMALTFTADGAHAITGGCDGQLSWWETAAETPTPIRTIEAHKGWIRRLATSPDGALIASAGNDGFVRLWNPLDGSLLRELAASERNIYSVVFHPGGQFLLSGDLVGGIKQWDVATGELVREFDGKPLWSYNSAGQGVDFGGVRSLAVSPDGKWLAAGGLHNASNPLGAVHQPLVLLFDWESQELSKKQVAEGITGGAAERLAWLADGSLMGVSGGSSGGFLFFWMPDAEKDHHRLSLGNIARDMDLHPDGLRVATAHHDKHVRITRLAPDPPAETT